MAKRMRHKERDDIIYYVRYGTVLVYKVLSLHIFPHSANPGMKVKNWNKKGGFLLILLLKQWQEPAT